MEINLYELSGKQTACKTKRNVEYDFQAGSKDYILKSHIIKTIIRAMLLGELKEPELEETIEKKFSELDLYTPEVAKTIKEIIDADSIDMEKVSEELGKLTTEEEKIKKAEAFIDSMRLRKLTETELETELDARFKELGYLSEKQRRIQSADAYKQIMRYVNAEKRPYYIPKTKVVQLSDELPVKVKPDAVFFETTKGGQKQIEIIRWHCKKPDVTQRSASENLELYALLKYGRLLVNPGEKVVLVASLYFLRKQNDSNNEEKACFELDFFKTTAGRNIVSLIEEYDKPATSVKGVDDVSNDTDDRFADMVDEFVDGIPEEECRATDCAKCDFEPICKFTDPPMSLPIPKTSRVARGVKLTTEQREAKEYEEGIVRINAGAGAGKTLTISLRVISLLNKGVLPKEIFMTTFTNAGAQEMRERIAMLAEDDGIAEEVDMSEMKIMTFNAFGDEIIRNEYPRFGFKEAPHLIDDVERFRIVSNLLKKHEIEGLDYRNFTTNEPRIKGAVPTAAKAFEVFKKNPTLGISDIETLYNEKFRDYTAYCSKKAFLELYRYFSDYDELLRDNCLMEFSDQENLIFELLGMEPYYFEKYGFKHLIIDEFQDSSETQINIIKRLTACPSFKSLMVVGDDSQAIYSFRDTTPDFIINFDKVMGCKIDDIQLLENHRSTPEIIEFANRINRINVHRIAKDLIATRDSGEPVYVQGFLTSEEEQEFVVNKVKERIDSGVKPEDIAILARNKSELNKIADLLGKQGIASVIQFPEKLIEDSRVKALISMLKAIKDASNTTALLIYANALVGGRLKGADKETIADACEQANKRILDFKALTDEAEKKETLKKMFDELDADEKDSLYQQFKESLMIRTSDKIFDYAEDFSLFGKNQAVKRTGFYPGVVLSTAHSSKGLEWPVVFNMIGSYDKKELHGNMTRHKTERIEEERRLLFVSSTRARDVLYVTAPYTSGGHAGEYVYNQFLMDAYKANDQEFSVTAIEKERYERKKAKEEQKKKEKALKKEAEEMEKLLKDL